MKFLVIAKQKKNVDTFETVLGELLARGHDVTLAIQQRDPERDGRLAERLRHERFALVPCPDGRTDGWRAAAPLARTARDWAQYTRPAYRTASKLHRRAVERLFRELGAPLSGEAPALGRLPAHAFARRWRTSSAPYRPTRCTGSSSTGIGPMSSS